MHLGPDLQRRAVLRERGAEEGVDGVKHHVDDVFLQDGIRKSLLSLVTNLQKEKEKHMFIFLMSLVLISCWMLEGAAGVCVDPRHCTKTKLKYPGYKSHYRKSVVMSHSEGK